MQFCSLIFMKTSHLFLSLALYHQSILLILLYFNDFYSYIALVLSKASHQQAPGGAWAGRPCRAAAATDDRVTDILAFPFDQLASYAKGDMQLQLSNLWRDRSLGGSRSPRSRAWSPPGARLVENSFALYKCRPFYKSASAFWRHTWVTG